MLKDAEPFSVAAGGVPADIEAIARAIDGFALSGVYFGATVGLSRAYPEIGIDALLNDRGRAAFETLGGQCIGEFAVGFAFQHMRDYVTVPELLDVPEVKAVIAENTMGQRLPAAPTYIYQGTHDELAITPPVDALVDTYCGMGAEVKYVKILGEHITTAGTGVPGALAYVNDRLAGKPAPSSCWWFVGVDGFALCGVSPFGESSPDGQALRDGQGLLRWQRGVWQGRVLPAIPSTSLRAITPRQGAGADAGVMVQAP